MKISEIFDSGVQQDVEKVVNRLKSFDWNYEFCDDRSRERKGLRDLAVLESQVYELWKKDPSTAINIWNKNVPHAAKYGADTTPGFIFRLEARESSNK